MIEPLQAKYCGAYSRALFFKYSKYNTYIPVTFRYPYQFDTEEFKQKLIKFIVDYISFNNIEINHFRGSKVFYIEVVEGKLEFTDKSSFKQIEGRYLTNLGIPYQGINYYKSR